MPLATPELGVEIAVSNMCFGPLERSGVPTWRSNLDQMQSFLELTGYRNYEIHPTQAIVPDLKDVTQKDVELLRALVGSLHQTFNDSKGRFGRPADLCGVQRRWTSIQGMDDIQRVLSHPVPSVHYADPHPPNLKTARLSYPDSFPVVQPKSEIYRDFCITDPEKLMDTLRELGMVGLCPDTVHSRERAKARKHEKEGAPSPPWREVWANQFASGDVYQMHVSADRRDVRKHDPELAAKSRQEFKAFVSGTWDDVMNTDLREMITQAIENWVPPQQLLRAIGAPVLRMVVEIPPWPGNVLRRVDQHQRFVNTLVALIRQTGATPLLWSNPASTAAAKV